MRIYVSVVMFLVKKNNEYVMIKGKGKVHECLYIYDVICV